MLYSVSGTQGCGKTTILATLAKMGHNVVTRKTSRSVLKDWNVTLYDVYKDLDLMTKFQDEIISRKYSDEKKYLESDDIWFTDRSYVDLLVYSTVILGHNVDKSDWLDSYFQKCKNYQKLYDRTFYISPLPYIVSDGIRNSNEVFNALVDYSILGYLDRLSKSKLVKICSMSNEARVTDILQHI